MNALFLTFVFPLIGFLLLSFSRGRLGENLSALIGVGSVGLSAATSAWIIYQFNVAPPEAGVFTQQLWVWMSVEGFAPSFTLHLDGLSLTMLGVVTGVGFLIHLFASWYMRGEEGYSRFFAYTNLFIFSMLLLVLGDNLLLLYFGWEGVGLCSYLLIGFYYSNPNNGNAALKAFIVTRVGDVFMAFGLFILYMQLGTLNIQELLTLAPQKFAAGDPWLTLATLALLGGAVGKSAQLPIYVWLPDAMAGPTPVSALIHAATMVTAGVYLMTRMNPVLAMASPYPMFTLVSSGQGPLIVLGIALAAACMASFYAVIAGYVSGMFETRVRYTAISLAYQICGALAGGLTPLIGTWLAHHFTGQWWPMAVFYTLIATLSLVCVLALARQYARSQHLELA